MVAISAPAMLQLMDDPQRSNVIKQGAEAKVYISQLFPSPRISYPSGEMPSKQQQYPVRTSTMVLLKYRFPKMYRHEILSSHLTASRTTAEARALVRCSKAGVTVPSLLCVDEKQGILGLEVIDGRSVREMLGGGAEGEIHDDEKVQVDTYSMTTSLEGDASDTYTLAIMSLIGEQIARMHQTHIIHGDLTTSNMMVRKPDEVLSEVVLIDFGLSSNSTSAEDKAVDLYVLERAFQSTHPDSDHLFAEILLAYQRALEAPKPIGPRGVLNRGQPKLDKGSLLGTTSWKEISRKLDDVRLRGRKRSMVG